MSNYTKIVTGKVLNAIHSYNMLEPNNEVIVGFSGGADSVCLLHILLSLKEKLNIVVKAAHVNHGIRGDEAKRDELFASAFSSQYGVEFYSEAFDCVAEAEKTGESLEECGRRIRYAFFNSLVSNNGKIATAHNANDNAETVIFNLARGASLKGVCGIPCIRDNIIRPLIFCTRQEIEFYCEENKLEYVTDSTNLSDEYSRNKIRHKILPVLTELNSCAVENITAFCTGAKQTDAFIRLQAQEALSQAFIEANTYDATVLQNCHIAVLKEALCIAYEAFCNQTLDRHKINDTMNLIVNSGRIQLYGDIFVEVVKKRLRFFRKSNGIELEPLTIDGLGIYAFGEYTLTLKGFTAVSSELNGAFSYNAIDCDKISGKLYLRTRREGDKITLFKRNVSKSLKKLFCEYNVPIEKRDLLPILCDDEGIVWVYGIGTVARCCVNHNSSDLSNIIYVEGENNGQ